MVVVKLTTEIKIRPLFEFIFFLPETELTHIPKKLPFFFFVYTKPREKTVDLALLLDDQRCWEITI